MSDPNFTIQLEGRGLLTAEIFYFMPDHPSVLQQYAWQDYDEAPDFPLLFDFLEFWKREIDAAIHSVRIAHDQMIRPTEWRSADVELLM